MPRRREPSRHDEPAGPGRRRRRPTVTIALMASAVVCPLLPIIMGALGWQGTIGFGVLVQPALGLVGGAAALFYRSIDFGVRVSWAAVSALSGFFLLVAWFIVLTLLFGP